jgi:cysteine desulfurase/selenocysteine lyase
MVDGAQAAPHVAIDVAEIGCDFYAFSGHKVYGPSGVGVLWGREALLEAMPPWQGGGDMIASVTFEKSTWNELPYKFEAGTPDIAGVVALGAALEWVEARGLAALAAHEADLLRHGTAVLQELPGLRLVGTAPEKASVLSFVLEGIHPHDAGTVLDYEGIAVRTGHHCAEPVMHRFGIPATARASLCAFNTKEELDLLVAGLAKVKEMFG